MTAVATTRWISEKHADAGLFVGPTSAEKKKSASLLAHIVDVVVPYRRREFLLASLASLLANLQSLRVSGRWEGHHGGILPLLYRESARGIRPNRLVDPRHERYGGE